MNNFLKLNELLQKASEQDKQYYYPTQRYMILNAFTKFIKCLEQRARIDNKQFKIISTSVKNIVRRIPTPAFSYQPDEIDENSKTTVISYCGFIYDDKYYYFEIDDNPFFPHYFAVVLLENNKIPDYYMKEWHPFDNIISNVYGNNIHENIQLHVEKMLNEFSRIQNESTKYIRKDKRRPVEIKQTYYINLY